MAACEHESAYWQLRVTENPDTGAINLELRGFACDDCDTLAPLDKLEEPAKGILDQLSERSDDDGTDSER